MDFVKINEIHEKFTKLDKNSEVHEKSTESKVHENFTELVKNQQGYLEIHRIREKSVTKPSNFYPKKSNRI